jgi:transketolase C-terminal domain/subunit
MTITETEEPDASADRLVRNLAWHGLLASKQVLHPGDENAVQTLLSAAEERAGLLVMGKHSA